MASFQHFVISATIVPTVEETNRGATDTVLFGPTLIGGQSKDEALATARYKAQQSIADKLASIAPARASGSDGAAAVSATEAERERISVMSRVRFKVSTLPTDSVA